MKWVRSKLDQQSKDVIKIANEDQLLMASVRCMKGRNVFLYFNGIEDEVVVDAFMDHLSKAWSELDLKGVTGVSVGCAFNKTKISDETRQQLFGMGWRHE
jgi:hypothetical protein